MDGDNAATHAQEVLEAAAALIIEEGAEGWSLSELAQRAGLAPEVVEAEFDSEWEVFCHVIRRDERRFERETFAHQKDVSASERIICLFEATVPNFDWSYWIELWPLALRDDRAKALCQELDERFRAGIEEIIRDGVASGEFKVADPRSVAITIATNATLGDSTVRPNYMLDACVTVSEELLEVSLPMPKQADRAEAGGSR